ncbi:GPBAR protein, partial [Amia calva]|nr:GPBAR protein [Amia calva]
MSLERELDFHTCLLVHIFPNFLFLSFLFNLVMVHYERYLCIIYPLHYKHFWAHRFFPLALLAVWLPPLLYASLPAFGWNNRKAIAIGNITNCSHNEMLEGAGGDCSTNRTWGKECSYKDVFPHAFIYLEVYGLLTPAICSIVFMTVRVLWIAREQLRDICKLHRAVQRDHPSEQEHRLNIRYVRCVVAVSLTFLVCWVPYIIYMHVSIIALSQDEKDKDPSTYIILSCTGIGSMAIIPAILGLGNRQYTEPVMNVCGKLRDRCRESKDTEDLTL